RSARAGSGCCAKRSATTVGAARGGRSWAPGAWSASSSGARSRRATAAPTLSPKSFIPTRRRSRGERIRSRVRKRRRTERARCAAPSKQQLGAARLRQLDRALSPPRFEVGASQIELRDDRALRRKCFHGVRLQLENALVLLR